MKTKSISTQQAKAPLTGTTGLFISSVPIKALAIEGTVGGSSGTTLYIQLLGINPASAVSGTTIPLWSRAVLTASAFSYVYEPDGVNTDTTTNPFGGTLATAGANTLPVYLAISSTDTVWTSVATATNATCILEEYELEIANQTVTGDTSTGVDTLTVFADPSTPNYLVKLVVTSPTGSTNYLMMFATSQAGNGGTPVKQWQFTTAQTQTLQFGEGEPVWSQDASGTNHNGCYLYGSSTTGMLTKTVATGWKMQGFNI